MLTNFVENIFMAILGARVYTYVAPRETQLLPVAIMKYCKGRNLVDQMKKGSLLQLCTNFV